jgi:hypothetical protein
MKATKQDELKEANQNEMNDAKQDELNEAKQDELKEAKQDELNEAKQDEIGHETKKTETVAESSSEPKLVKERRGVQQESEDDAYEQSEDSSEEEEEEQEEEDEENRPRTGALATKKRGRSRNADNYDGRGGEKARKVVGQNPNAALDARPTTNAPLAYPYVVPVPYQSPVYYYRVPQPMPNYAPTASYGQSYASTIPAYANPGYPIPTYTTNLQQPPQFQGYGELPWNLDSQFRELYCPHCGRREEGYYCGTCGRRRQ